MTNKELKEKIARLETELVEVKEMAEAMKKRADGGGVFKPQDEEKYWYISGSGEAYVCWWKNHPTDHDRYSIGNCYPTEQAAENAIRVLKLTQKARETQNGFVPDWENATQRKHSLYFDRVEICVTSHISLNIAPVFGHWEDKSVCEQFIYENEKDLLWFFTEYRR